MFGIFMLIFAAVLVVGGMVTAVSPRSEITTRAAGGGALALGVVIIALASLSLIHI